MTPQSRSNPPQEGNTHGNRVECDGPASDHKFLWFTASKNATLTQSIGMVSSRISWFTAIKSVTLIQSIGMVSSHQLLWRGFIDVQNWQNNWEGHISAFFFIFGFCV
eukprot:EG_transcript_50124